MAMTMQKAVETLSDTGSGWVHRRDAADFLGRAVRHAMDALQAFSADKDPDVQQAVQQALQQLEGSAGNTSGNATALTLENLAFSCEKPERRVVTQEGDRFCITVRTGEGRSQRVYLEQQVVKDESALHMFTLCGKAEDAPVSWTLQMNGEMQGCAFALTEIEGEEYLVLRHYMPWASVTFRGTKRMAKALAQYGDWVEKKISEGDQF